MEKILPSDKSKAEPHYCYGGHYGAITLIFGLPFYIYFAHFISHENYCPTFGTLHRIPSEFITSVSKFLSIWNVRDQLVALGIVLSWWLFLSILAVIVPGKIVEGGSTPNGIRLKYKLNGFNTFWITIIAVAFCDYRYLSYLYDNYTYLITAAIPLGFLVSIYVYISSFKSGTQLSIHVINSKSRIYDFFIGRELNPRIGQLFDWKFLCELRPGLIAVVIFNFAMMVKQYEIKGYVSLPMILVNICQGIYVLDYFYNEEFLLTTIDITTDGFGFALAFGDLCFVPFTYGPQAKYLVHADVDLSPISIFFILTLFITGYLIFRKSNSEKDEFKRNPNSNPTWKFLTTSSGSKLLISGWWGLARKINYTGDFLMSLALCLFTGSDCIAPYLYMVYFAYFLIDRAIRDDILCAKKYGNDWANYKKVVPYMFIPYIF